MTSPMVIDGDDNNYSARPDKGKSVVAAGNPSDGKDTPWVEKYRPKSLDDVAAHRDIVDTSKTQRFPSCSPFISRVHDGNRKFSRLFLFASRCLQVLIICVTVMAKQYIQTFTAIFGWTAWIATTWEGTKGLELNSQIPCIILLVEVPKSYFCIKSSIKGSITLEVLFSFVFYIPFVQSELEKERGLVIY